MSRWHEHTVAVVTTVKNDAVGCAATLGSIINQTRPPDEIIVVDGGSTDGTRRLIRQYAATHPRLRFIEAPGANIARGRNIGIEEATSEIIATIDSGCRAEPEWLERLMKPFLDDRATEFVAGCYRIDPRTLLENVVGLATMRGQLDPVLPESFNPSARSMAFAKALWRRAGGWPEWLDFSEDTLFDHRVRRMDVGWRFAGEAVVHWRPRGSLSSIARQFYNYGTGRGHTQIDAASFRYNLRNLAIVAGATALCIQTLWFIPLWMSLFGYFYVWAFHRTARRIATRTGRPGGYVLSIVVMWVVLLANTAGYVVGSWQRWRRCDRYRGRMNRYLAGSNALVQDPRALVE